MRTLLWKDGRFKPLFAINKTMLLAALAMFLFASLDVAFHLRHNLEAFVDFKGDPIEEFERTSYWLNVVKMGCYVAQTFIGDSILIYRCWVVYNKNYFVVLLPFILWLGTTVCGTMTVYVEATLGQNNKALNSSSLVPFITSMLVLTLVTNVTATSLIVYRIWSIRQGSNRRSNVLEPSPLTNVLIVLIESGLIYTLSIIILFATYMASNNAQYGVSNSVVQIIGITFNLIITSVDRGTATGTSPGTLPTRSFISNHNSTTNAPLHMVNIQTTVTRFPDKDIPPHRSRTHSDSDRLDALKPDWEGESR